MEVVLTGEENSWEQKEKLQAMYLTWLTLPGSQRTPSTKKEVAEVIGRDIRTLQKWEVEPEFNAKRLRMLIAHFAPSTPDVIEALKYKALDGDTAAIRLWLEKIESLSDKLQVYVDAHVEHNVTYQQVLEIIRHDSGSNQEHPQISQ